jgi:hypothetical protein
MIREATARLAGRETKWTPVQHSARVRPDGTREGTKHDKLNTVRFFICNVTHYVASKCISLSIMHNALAVGLAAFFSLSNWHKYHKVCLRSLTLTYVSMRNHCRRGGYSVVNRITLSVILEHIWVTSLRSGEFSGRSR